jgi:hypothetical protein
MMPDPNTPTPLTDYALSQCIYMEKGMVPADFARQLERENADLRGQLEAERKAREKWEEQALEYAEQLNSSMDRDEADRLSAESAPKEKI